MKRIALVPFILSEVAFGGVPVNIGPIGTHYEIFRFEKSENPQNALVVYTRLDERCRFILESENPTAPAFGFYWLMDKKTYKPVHPLIRGGISSRLKVTIPPNFPQVRDFFVVEVKELRRIDPVLQDAYVKVSAGQQGKNCQVEASFDVDGDRQTSHVLMLDKIFAESEKTFLPPFRKVISLRFDGVNQKTGESEQKLFKEKK